jgi:DNA-binding winged helix-turn-helix (wHTH) protein/tetratricopeptide (TPR) repeat protein
MVNKEKRFYEFGPFRIDPDRRVLLRENRQVPLQSKAFEILLVLVENSDGLVLKDDLMKAVWPETFVEESNLTQHIFVLRKTLGDAVGENRYIITVPGRGYRFSEKVRIVSEGQIVTNEQNPKTPDDDDELVVETHTRSRLVVEEQRLPVKGLPAKRGSLRMFAVSVGVIAALLAVAFDFYLHRAPKLTEKDTIVLADFANSTGDAVFDGALRQGLSAQLEQSPFLNLLSDQRVAQTLSLMGQPADTRLAFPQAKEVCQRTASSAVLDGSIAQIGTRYLLTLNAINCSSGDSLAMSEMEARDKNHVLDALGKMASDIRAKLGESLASVEKYDVPPENVTTPSLEALRAYSLGHKALASNLADESVSLYGRAISLDPKFAMAYLGLGIEDFNLDETSRAAENVQKAYQLRERVSEREKLAIEVAYNAVVMRNFEAAEKSQLLFTQIYPRPDGAYANLGTIATYLGDYDRSLAACQKALELNPGAAQNYSNLLIADLHLNRLPEARSVARDAYAHKLDRPFIHSNLYLVEFLSHDDAGMDREAKEAIGKPASENENLVLYYKSDTAAYSGQFERARQLTKAASDIALRQGDKETKAGYEAEAAVREAMVGNMGLAQRQARDALAFSNGRDVTAMSAIALALAGSSAEALRLSDELAKRFPEDTVVQYNSLPAIRAAVALERGDSAKAIEVLATSTPYELGQTAQQVTFVLYPVYLRGEAYLAAKEGGSAKGEFEKIIDHPGLVQNELIGSLAHLGLGRAYVVAGDKEKARVEYQNFIALWKDADGEIPVLRRAKAEAARLQ